MWDKVLIGVLAGLLLAGCGQSVGEGANTQDVTSNTTIESVSDTLASSKPNTPIGYLKGTSSNEAIASVEARLSAYLSGDMPRVKFAQTAPPYLQSVGGSKPPMNLGWRGMKNPKGLYLVIRHLKPIAPEANAIAMIQKCGTSKTYTGYAAANPNLDVYIDTETGPVWNWAIPYGLVVCDLGDDFDVMALSINDPAFDDDPKKEAILKALPKDHPFFSSL